MGIRVKAANRVQENSDGYATGLFVEIREGKGIATVKKSKTDIDERHYERFEFVLEVDGTVSPIEITVFTGTNLNHIPQDYVGRGRQRKPVYNRLTTFCLALGLLKYDELNTDITPDIVDRVTESLNNLEGERVRFKLGQVEGKSITAPRLETFELIPTGTE